MKRTALLWQSPDEWLAEDLEDPGYQLLSDDIITVVRYTLL